MKRFLQTVFLQCICFAVAAQQPVISELLPENELNPSALRSIRPPDAVQHHAYAPEMILYSWDTLGNYWVYKYTAFMNYSSDSLLVSDLSYDTVANVPLQRDTTVFDALGRILNSETQTWNAGWQNSFKMEHTYWDTNFFNRTTRYYNGSGTTWTLYHCDSTYGMADINGNLVENYYDLFDIPSGQYNRGSKTLTDFDGLNRIEKRRAYHFDTTSAQYVIQSLDSNFVYDNVYTDLTIDKINYTYNIGVQSPHLRNLTVFNSIYEMDRIETLKQYNNTQQTWEDYNRYTLTGQSCNYMDSSLHESWTNGTGWQPDAGTRYIYSYIDSCDYDEFIIQHYISWLYTYRNAYKWVYPVHSTSGILKPVLMNPEIVISPNPIHTSATINFTGAEDKVKSGMLKIYNCMGSLVREEKIPNINSYTLHRGSLSDGLYFYELITADYELIGTGKFVVE